MVNKHEKKFNFIHSEIMQLNKHLDNIIIHYFASHISNNWCEVVGWAINYSILFFFKNYSVFREKFGNAY